MAPRKESYKIGPFTISKGFALGMFGILVLGMLAAIMVSLNPAVLPFQQTPTGTEEQPVEGYYTVDALIRFTCRDMYNGTISSVDGTLTLYDPNNMGDPLETITLTSGIGTSARQYTSGDKIGVVYGGSSTYLPFSWEVEAPQAKSNDAGQTLNLGEHLEVVARPARADWAIYIQKAGADVWSNDSAAVADAFDPQTDDDDVSMGIRYRVAGDNEAFAVPTTWTDYSQDNPDLQTRKSYWVIRFGLNSSGTTMDAEAIYSYLKFNDLGGGMIKDFGDQVVLFKEITTDIEAGLRDTDTQGNTQNGMSGNAVVWTLEFDFSGGIANTDWEDEITIDVSITHGFALTYAEDHSSLTQSGDVAYGYMASDFSNRCTIG